MNNGRVMTINPTDLEHQPRKDALFGAHPGSVRVRDGVDLTAPVLDVKPDAESGQEIDR